jgi:hypothetical protein
MIESIWLQEVDKKMLLFIIFILIEFYFNFFILKYFFSIFILFFLKIISMHFKTKIKSKLKRNC